MRNLQIWDEYTRQDVHTIFSPETKFTPQAGTWGVQGMIRIPARRGDWAFFVTFGKIQGEHQFDESITEEGVLSWQSQPAMQLTDEAIRELIHHDDRVNNIYLFLRTEDRIPYTYLGTLGYTSDCVRLIFQRQSYERIPAICRYFPLSPAFPFCNCYLIPQNSRQFRAASEPFPKPVAIGVQNSSALCRRHPDHSTSPPAHLKSWTSLRPEPNWQRRWVPVSKTAVLRS